MFVALPRRLRFPSPDRVEGETDGRLRHNEVEGLPEAFNAADDETRCEFVYAALPLT